nr:MAG: Prophage endopeptidase tail [Bacteriophage sp.]
MYQVYYKDKLVYDLRDEDLIFIDPVLNLEASKAGSFEFKIPPTHPHYGLFQKMVSEVVVKEDGVEIFRGRVIEDTELFNKVKRIFCEGDLAYLNDSIQHPTEYHDMSVRGYLETIISEHNKQVTLERRFQVGIVTVKDSNDSLFRYTNWESTMQTIKEDLVDDLGGYIRTRYENGIRYIDYIADTLNTCTQSIRFGENLLDFTRNFTVEDLVTVLIPLGAKLEESTIKALEERLTIKEVNNNSVELVNQTAVNHYGRITKVVKWDNVHTPANLKKKGEAYLKEGQWENAIIEAKAVDLHLADSAVERFKILDSIHVVSVPHGLDKFFPLTKLSIPLDKPSNATITLGSKEKVTLTAQTNNSNTDLLDKLEKIPSPNKILQQAQDNASQLIQHMTNGYMVYESNEMLCMDTPDKNTARNVWRFNLGGFGHSDTGYNGRFTTAITMDGWILGDRIASNSIDASKLTIDYTTSVENKINLAESNAENYTDGRLQNYYTASEINYKLQVNKDGILLQAKETAYGYTDGRLQDYYDRWTVDNKIKVGTDGILIQAKSEAKSYTDKMLTGYYTKYEVNNQINTSKDGILIQAKNTAYQYTDNKFSNVYTKTETNSQINASKNGILLQAEQTATNYVDNRLRNYYTSSQIDVKTNRIEQSVSEKVNNSDFGTKISQNAYYVRMAWNNNSRYIQFENSELNIYDTGNQKLMSLTYSGCWYYYKGNKLGMIGTNSWKGDDTFRGLLFQLNYGGDYMGWGHQETSGGNYQMYLVYYANNRKSKKGLHFNCSTYSEGNLWVSNSCQFIEWSDGTCGIRGGSMTWSNTSNTSAVEISGQNKSFKIYNNVAVDIYTNINMHGYSIKGQSDARMKKNIVDTSVNALDVINSVDMKSFDWIENGEHETIGIIAQQLQDVAPELVYEEKDGHLSIYTLKLVYYCMKAIQELSGVKKKSTWKDPYTMLEKMTFCKKLEENNQKKENEHEDLILPNNQKGMIINGN